MIRWRLFGDNTILTGVAPVVKITPFSLTGTQTDITVGTAEVSLAGVAARDHLYTLRNISQSGQQIRIARSGTPSFATNTGILLYPGESIQLYFVGNDWACIADAAGGTLNLSVNETAV